MSSLNELNQIKETQTKSRSVAQSPSAYLLIMCAARLGEVLKARFSKINNNLSLASNWGHQCTRKVSNLLARGAVLTMSPQLLLHIVQPTAGKGAGISYYMHFVHHLSCLRPYHREYTGSRPITAVKHGRARSVPGWVTAWEHLVL